MKTLRQVSATFGAPRKRRVTPRRRAALLDRLRAHARVEDIEREPTDGWFVTLKDGWKSANDPMVPVHCFGADTLTEAMREVNAALPCDCDQCMRTAT